MLISRADRRSSREQRYSVNHHTIRATINRKTLAEDGFRQLNHEGPRLRGRIQITFVDQYVHLHTIRRAILTEIDSDKRNLG
jgi:hypothetical protein